MKNNPVSHQSQAACPLCSSTESTVLTPELRRGHGEVHYCPSCEHGYLVGHEIVDEKEYYGELYRQEYSHKAEAAVTHAQEIFEIYKSYQQERLRHISHYLAPDSRLLEVGASAGQFLMHVKDQVGEVNAIELDRACCEFLTGELGIAADAEFLENSKFAGQVYDVVCAFQVMEHVEHPVEFLKTLRNASKPGGVIFVEVPNLRDPLLSVWDVPAYHKFYYHSAHIHYFTESSLCQVAREAGFNADQIETNFTQDYNLLNHLHWIMNNGPQADCHVGLSEVALRGSNQEMAAWLTDEMRELNNRYVAKLVESKRTSNILMKLRHD